MVLLLIGVVLANHYSVNIKSFAKIFLTLPDLSWYAGAFSIVITIVHKIKTGKISFNSGMSFKDFRASINDVIAFIDNPIIIVGSLALARGLFLHYTENIQFSPFLNTNEILLILMVTAYLLYISIFELWRNIIEIVGRDDKRNENQITPVEVTKDTEVPKPLQNI